VADVSHLNKPKMNSIISKRCAPHSGPSILRMRQTMTDRKRLVSWTCRFRIFLNQCRRRRVRVHLLPQGMAKRKQNTSYYSIKCVQSFTNTQLPAVNDHDESRSP
jgi:hypothetical protein